MSNRYFATNSGRYLLTSTKLSRLNIVSTALIRHLVSIKQFCLDLQLSSAHALGGVSGVASFITTDEQLQ